MIGSKSMLLWLPAVASLCGSTHGEVLAKTASYESNPQHRGAGRALRKDELFFLDVTKKPTAKPSPKPAPATVELQQPLGQSGMTFDKLFDLLDEHDRYDELVFMAVTRPPTDKPTKKPTEEPTTVSDIMKHLAIKLFNLSHSLRFVHYYSV